MFMDEVLSVSCYEYEMKGKISAKQPSVQLQHCSRYQWAKHISLVHMYTCLHIYVFMYMHIVSIILL